VPVTGAGDRREVHRHYVLVIITLSSRPSLGFSPWVFPAAGPIPGHLECQVVRDLFMVRGRLGALLLITRSICSVCGLRNGRSDTDRKACYLVLFVMCSLRQPSKDTAVSAKSALRTRAFCKLVAAAARKERFGAKPSSAVMVRQRRSIDSYFDCSTVFRKGEEAFMIFFR
jgi:hypothetical protein